MALCSPVSYTHLDVYKRQERTWPLFFARQRLLPQLELAKRKGYKGKLIADGERLAEKLPAMFVDYQPDISLLHGLSLIHV